MEVREKMSTSRSVKVVLTAETAQYIAAMQEAGTMTADAMTSAEEATASQSAAVDGLAEQMGALGAATTAALAVTGKAAMDWESQFAGVEKTVDGTATQMAALEGELRELAKSMPATHEEIAATAEAAGQLGVAREDISAFTKTMIDLGETTNLTADEAATSIAQLTNVMGTAPEDVDRLGSALVALGNDGASTEAEIVQMAQRIAGAGAQIGMAESDILALANAASSMGIEVEAGGSSISTVLMNMGKAAKQGGAQLEGLADVAGMSATEFARAFEEDPARAFASFTQGLDRIKQSGGDVFTTLDELGFKDVRVVRSLLSMASAGDLLTDSLDLGAAAWEENTALTDEAAKRYETTASKVAVAWNQIKDAAIEAGGVLLPIIAEGAEGVGALADGFGDLPGPIQTGMVALAALTAVAATGFWAANKLHGAYVTARTGVQAMAPAATRASAAVNSLSGGMLTAQQRATMSASALDKHAAAAARFRTGMVRAAGPIAAMALLTTGAAEGVGVQNTAMLGLMGMMLGPWGAAVGASVGLLLDFRKESKQAGEATRELDKIMGDSSSTYEEMTSALSSTQDTYAKKYRELVEGGDSVGGALKKTLTDPIEAANYAISGFDGSSWLNDMGNASEEAAAKMAKIDTGLVQIGLALGDTDITSAATGWQSAAPTLDELGAVAERVAPAMEALGLTYDDLADKGAQDRITAWIKDADSEAGRVEALGEAVAGLEDDMMSTAEAAEALGEALDSLLGPGMNLSAAWDSWSESLRSLKDDLSENSKTLEGNSEAALQNREAIRSRVTGLVDVLKAEAEAGAGSDRLTRVMGNQRQALFESAEALGMNRGELKQYLTQLGFTPKLVETLIQANTSQAEQDISRVQRQLNKYGLTTANGKAALDDVASGRIKTVQGLINKYGMTRAEAKALLRDAASGAIAAVAARLAALDGTVATTTIRTINETVNKVIGGAANFLRKASGGPIVGPGTKTSDDVPVMASNGEFMMSAAAVDYWGLDRMFAMNARRLAAGGPVTGPRTRAVSAAEMSSMATREAEAAIWNLGNAAAGAARSTADGSKTEVKARERRIKQLEREVSQAEKSFEAEKDRLDQLKQAYDEFADAVSSRFTSDLWAEREGFATSVIELPDNFAELTAEAQAEALERRDRQQVAMNDTMWAINAQNRPSATDIARGDLAQVRELTSLLQTLAERGLDGPAFQELARNAPLEQVRAYASGPLSELRQYERVTNALVKARGTLGDTAGGLEFGKDIREQTKVLRESREEMRDATQELRQAKRHLADIKKASEDAPAKTGAAVGRALNNSAAQAKRNSG